MSFAEDDPRDKEKRRVDDFESEVKSKGESEVEPEIKLDYYKSAAEKHQSGSKSEPKYIKSKTEKKIKTSLSTSVDELSLRIERETGLARPKIIITYVPWGDDNRCRAIVKFIYDKIVTRPLRSGRYNSIKNKIKSKRE